MFDNKTKTRFNKKVAKPNANGCQLWTAAMFTFGAGAFKFEGKVLSSNRVAWEMHHDKDVPAGLQVYRTCGVRGCCAPDHLKLGTQAENTANSRAAGRTHSKTKISAAGVRMMRRLHAAGTHSQKQLAARYSLSQPYVSQILSRKAWSHIK